MLAQLSKTNAHAVFDILFVRTLLDICRKFLSRTGKTDLYLCIMYKFWFGLEHILFDTL